MNKYEKEVAEKGELPGRSFPGGYPIYYIDEQNNVYCEECAAERAEDIVDHRCYMEGPSMYCDQCNKEIESAYGEPEDDKKC